MSSISSSIRHAHARRTAASRKKAVRHARGDFAKGETELYLKDDGALED